MSIDTCPVCTEVFKTPNVKIPDTLDTLIFFESQPLPSVMRPEAHSAAVMAFAEGIRCVKFHVKCCFDLKPTRSAVKGPVTLSVVKKTPTAKTEAVVPGIGMASAPGPVVGGPATGVGGGRAAASRPSLSATEAPAAATCPRCRHEVSDTARFCASCGERVCR